jgi:hypothetical protein
MMLGFKRRFAPFVWEGTKRHTIRAERKDKPIRPGDRLDCYVDPRQRTMALLGRWECTKIEDIRIVANRLAVHVPLLIWVEGTMLDPLEAELLLWKDGFRDQGGETFTATFQAAHFWEDRLSDGKHWRGLLQHWRFHEETRTPFAKLPAWLRKAIEAQQAFERDPLAGF